MTNRALCPVLWNAVLLDWRIFADCDEVVGQVANLRPIVNRPGRGCKQASQRFRAVRLVAAMLLCGAGNLACSRLSSRPHRVFNRRLAQCQVLREDAMLAFTKDSLEQPATVP